jgi:hypothetical protein
VTVCIAAIASDGRIVTASDTLVSFGNMGSSDKVSVKMEPFHRSWTALMAGTMPECMAIIEIAQTTMEKCRPDLRSVASGFKKAYHAHLSETAADTVLGRYQMDMQEFKKTGLKKFGSERFNLLDQAIRDVAIDCEFLVFGFDEQHHPRLFTVTPPGVVSLCDKPGFWTIGSGSFAALGMLFSLGQSVDTPFEETIFNVLTAKFMAETPGVVGKHTHLFAKEEGNDFFSYPSWLEPTIRKWWEEHGKPRRDDGIIQQMRQDSMLKFALKNK